MPQTSSLQALVAPPTSAPTSVPSASPAGHFTLGLLASQAWVVLHKDLLLAWRERARRVSVVVFGIVSLALFSFAVGPDTALLAAGAPGFLMLALLLASTLGLAESFRREHQHGALEGLLLLPIEPSALFYGKTLANAIFLFLLAPFLVPVALILYTADAGLSHLLPLVAIWGLAALGLAAPGTFYAGMTSRIESQDVLLPLLLFPLVVPVLQARSSAAVMASSCVFWSPMVTRRWRFMPALFHQRCSGKASVWSSKERSHRRRLRDPAFDGQTRQRVPATRGSRRTFDG